MGVYEKHVLPRVLDLFMSNRVLTKERKLALEGVHGEVLEIGFGSGLNLPWYGSDVQRVVGVDPSATGRKLAADRINSAPFEVELIGGGGEELDGEADRFDTIVSTFTLCTIPSVDRALANLRRSLKPGGRFHFLEHGAAPDAKVLKWQRRLEPFQKRIGGGCHLTREIDALIGAAGFEIEKIERYYVKGPRPMSFMYRGVAVRRDAA